MKYTFLLFTFFLFIGGCSKDTISNNQATAKDDNPSIIMFDNQSSPPLFKDQAILRSSSVAESVLTMNVEYGGGCEKHDLSLFGYSLFLKSNPPQAEVFLSHNGNGDMCEALIHKEVKFNLLPLLDSCRQQFGTGQILLRIHEPDSTNPITPLVSASF